VWIKVQVGIRTEPKLPKATSMNCTHLATVSVVKLPSFEGGLFKPLALNATACSKGEWYCKCIKASHIMLPAPSAATTQPRGAWAHLPARHKLW
jgi:hypothetical protein